MLLLVMSLLQSLTPFLAVSGGTAGVQQRVSLRIRPHVGDTLRMKLDQQVEMTDAADTGAAAKPMTATMRIATRTVVLHCGPAGTELLSMTDSVSLTPSGAAGFPMFSQTKRALEGRTVRLRVGTDGAITLPGDKSSPSSASAVLAQVPAVLPRGGVRVGDSWVRDLRVPVPTVHGTTGLVSVTFHLDSLGPDQGIAYISLHGTLSHDHDSDKPGTQGQTAGTITGTMQVDRRLEWLTDSRMIVTLISLVAPPGKGEPKRVHVKVTQWLRVVPAP
jgi:hypothetical protein